MLSTLSLVMRGVCALHKGILSEVPPISYIRNYHKGLPPLSSKLTERCNKENNIV